jgi:hypothetical protein
MKQLEHYTVAKLLAFTLACGLTCSAQSSRMVVVNRSPLLRPSPASPLVNASPVSPRSNNGIQYNGGPVMNSPHGVNVYFIWYGDWSKDTAAQAVVTDFITHLGGSPYFNINTTYYNYQDGEIDPVKNRVNFMGGITDHYSYGKSLSDDDVGNVIENAVTSGKLPADPNGVYALLTSADVHETSGFCTSYCAFHGYQPVTLPKINNLVIAFVGNVDQCAYNCASEYQLPTPNNNVGADGMVAAMAHELSESVSDPLGTGWINADGSENADLCEWTFGATEFLPNGSFYNVRLGSRPYLTQQIWVNARGGYCAMSWDK